MKIVRRNYFILLLLGLVFLTPGIAAYFFYTHPYWLAATPTNKGVFLNPPVLLAPLEESGAKWRFVLWSPGACEANCIAQLDKLARIRLALGRRLYGVVTELVLGVNAPPLSDELVKALRERDIHILKLVTGTSESMPVLQNRLEVFIANPDSYLVLEYQPTVKPDDIYNDIKQLLTTTDKMSK